MDEEYGEEYDKKKLIVDKKSYIYVANSEAQWNIYFEIVNRYSINQHISEIYRRPKKLLNAFKNIFIYGQNILVENVFT